jgi:L-Ala-D/L-Glu epimerase
MRILQINIYKSSIKLKEPFITSLSKHSHAENIIVVIHTDDGLKGFGECSPFMTINGESADTCLVVGQYLGKQLIGKHPLNIDECVMLMDLVIYGNSSIKSAFNIALYDIASQYAGMPLYEFLGGKKGKVLTTDYTVCLDDVSKMVDDAIKIRDKGFQTIKVKLGGSKEDDVERIRGIREAIGSEIKLRIDANQGWNVDDAIHLLNELAAFDIQFCEEPIARWNFTELPRIKFQSQIPIMADESCCDHHDAQRLIDLNACSLLNIKLGKSSGITNALKIIVIAEKNDMKLQVGGFLESRLGFTASAHLALVSDNILYCDFDTPLMFEDDIISGGITYTDNGIITIPDGVGLGASIDEQLLNRMPCVEIK